MFPRAVAGEERWGESTASFHAKSSDQKFDGIACAGVCLAVRGWGGVEEIQAVEGGTAFLLLVFSKFPA